MSTDWLAKALRHPRAETTAHRTLSTEFALFGQEQFELLSPLPPDECGRRLNEIAVRTNRHPASRFKLRVRRSWFRRGNWTLVIGKWWTLDPRTHVRMRCIIRADGRASRIHCLFYTLGIVPLGFGLVLPCCGIASLHMAIGAKLAELTLMAATLIGMMSFRPDAATERRVILNFLRRSISAQEATIARERR